jgi:amidohydrolase
MRTDLDRAVRVQVDRAHAALIGTRRHLHAHPELAFAEVATAALVARRCGELGVTARTGVGGTGVLADLDSGRPGPTVLIRADMDALPIDEDGDDRPYRSTVPGVMHACGHDGHVAVALTVGRVLAALRTSWPGRVRLCFQPAEEIDAGAARMITDGALDSVDHAVGLHLQTGIPTGTVAIGTGVQWASTDDLLIEVRGVGGHAGDPTGVVDPILIASRIVLALEGIDRDKSFAHRVVARIAKVDAGTASNIIPATARLTGTMRAFSALDRARLRAEVEWVARDIAGSAGGTVDVTFGAGCPPVVCDPAVTVAVREGIRDAVGADRVVDAVPGTGADDMGHFLAEVPGCYFRVGVSDPAAGPPVPHHHPRFDLDERALPEATIALASAALRLLRG